jgi:hypothetical protein
MLADEFGPRGDGGEDLAEPLGVEREGTQRHVAMLGREDHGLHRGDLGDGELARAGAGTRRAIVKGAGCRGVAPGMVTSRFEAENPEDQAQGQPRPGVLDGTEDVRLGSALRQSSAAEVEAGHPEQSQQEANDGGENPSSAVESGDGLEELLSVLFEDLRGDDRTQTAPLPGRDGGAGDGDAVVEGPGAGADDVLAQAMVVRATRARSRAGGNHHGRITRRSSGTKSRMISRMPLLRTEFSGMSAHAAGMTSARSRSGKRTKVREYGFLLVIRPRNRVG